MTRIFPCHAYSECDSANSYHPNQEKKKEKAYADNLQITACIYLMRKENNNSHPGYSQDS